MAFTMLIIVACIPFFFIVATVLIVNAIRSNRRFSLKHLLVFVAVIAAIFTVSISLKRLVDPFDNEAFDANLWRKGSQHERARMAHNLVRYHLPKGLSQSEVKALIGQPFKVQKPNDPDAWKVIGAEAHLYEIESFGAFGIDPAVLRVHYDASGRVLEAEITYLG